MTRKIESGYIKVSYMISLEDEGIADDLYYALNRAISRGETEVTEYAASICSHSATILEWATATLDPQDAIEWSCEINDMHLDEDDYEDEE